MVSAYNKILELSPKNNKTGTSHFEGEIASNYEEKNT